MSDFMGGFFEDFTIDKLLAATSAFNQQRIDGRVAEMKAQAQINSTPWRLSNPNASSNPAAQTSGAGGFVGKYGMTLALLAVAGLVAWKALR